MAKSFKARGMKTGGGEGSNIDYKALHDQVDTGTIGARICSIIDLGFHKEDVALGDKGQTGFLTVEDAEQWISEAKKKYGVKHSAFKAGDPDIEDADSVEIEDRTKTLVLEDDGNWTVTDESPEYIVALNEYGGEKEYQELAIYADLTETIVDYGPDIGEKPFRICLNRHWNKELKGFQLKKSPPAKKGDPWTVKSNTKLAELATATGHKDLLEVDLEDADWSEILGEGFNVTIEKSGDEDQYLNVGKCVALKKKKDKKTGKVEIEALDELENEPVLILFDDVTADDLEAAFIRGDAIKKIKSATDYKGSMMQKAVEEYEARLKSKSKSSGKDSDESDEDKDEEEEEKVERKVTKVKKETKPKATSKKAKPDPEPEDDEDSGDDSEDDSEDWDE